MQEKDEFYMHLCLKEAAKGMGFTSPNPLVGSVIVKNDVILSTGWHTRDGAAHAEVEALKNLTLLESTNATLYVNLEPCCHQGRTPPCTNAIINAGIKRVVVANLDPDPRVSGQGIKILQDANIEVETGILSTLAAKLNSIYFFHKVNKRPYIVLKAALTLDGKISTFSHNSKWISNEPSREIVHKLRKRLKAVAIGKNTFMHDNPQLNCRLEGFSAKPVDKLIFSHNTLNISNSNLLNSPGNAYILERNITHSVTSFYEYCNTKGIDSILVEGGGRLFTWFLQNQSIDRIFLFYKPSFLGSDGIPVFTGTGTKDISELEEFNLVDAKCMDNNIMIDLAKGEPLCLLDS